MFDETKIAINENDKKICTILAEICLMKMKSMVDEFNEKTETNNWIADKACQEVID